MKTFSKMADFAVFGAPPAFLEPIHVGSPNMGNRKAFLRRVELLLDSRRFTNNGPMVQELEQRLAEYLQVRHCIAICNGTVALEIAIRALGLRGEVIVPSFTFVATAHALQWQEITPVFADIEPETYGLDPARIEQLITPRTTGIIGVHVWGGPCNVEALQQIADRHGLKLMFDAAHAFGCSRNGTMVGNFGECEVLSFHATKFFNTFEGGAIVTNDAALATKLRLMRNFGFQGTDDVIHVGTNGKMAEICAAMGLAGFETIGETVAANRRIYRRYLERIADVPGLRIFAYPSEERTNYQYVVIDVQNDFPVTRDQLVTILNAENILARRYFYPGCHEMQPYRTLFPEAGKFLPNTVAACSRVLCLPTGVSVRREDVDQIADILSFIAVHADAMSLSDRLRHAATATPTVSS